MENSLHTTKYIFDNCNFGITGFYFRKWKSCDMDLHVHNQIEIMYVQKGQCVVDIQDVSYPMKEGHFVILDAAVPHKLWVEEGLPCSMFNIEFVLQESENFPAIGEIIRRCNGVIELLQSEHPYFFAKDGGGISSVFKHLISELEYPHEDGGILVQLLLSELLIKISRCIREANREHHKADSAYVKKAIDYIRKHYEDDIRVQDIADSVNINVSYLQRLFKISQNCSLVDYLTHYRLDQAKIILANTNIPIIDVCNHVGIGSRQYFTYLFKKHTGFTPKEYRQTSERHGMS